jgi:hypothetical protein
MADKESNKLRTPLFRAAFCSVFAKRAYEEGEPKFEITFLFPKDGKDKANLATLKKAAHAAALEKWGSKEKIPKGLKSPFRDGDETEWDGFAGHTFVRASSLYRPKVINREGVELMTDEEFYAGCWAYATVNAYAYDTKGNKGVSFGLQNLLFVRDDEPFSGRSSAEDDFSDLIEEGAGGEEGGDAAPGSDDEDIFS